MHSLSGSTSKLHLAQLANCVWLNQQTLSGSVCAYCLIIIIAKPEPSMQMPSECLSDLLCLTLLGSQFGSEALHLGLSLLQTPLLGLVAPQLLLM